MIAQAKTFRRSTQRPKSKWPKRERAPINDSLELQRIIRELANTAADEYAVAKQKAASQDKPYTIKFISHLKGALNGHRLEPTMPRLRLMGQELGKRGGWVTAWLKKEGLLRPKKDREFDDLLDAGVEPATARELTGARPKTVASATRHCQQRAFAFVREYV